MRSGGNTRSRFVYTPRDTSTVQKRATQSGGSYDTFFDSRFTKYTAQGGFNCIRILPPSWEGADHFGFDYFLHSNVGPDNSQYLCLEKMADLAELKGIEGGRCPVCEERRRLEREGDTEEANQMKVARRVGVWVIDRENERDGPKFYDMSWTMDKDIASLQINKRTGEAILIDDPEEGFDFEFQREGKGLNTRYIGKQIARQSSPISDDPKQQEQWLEFITEHPIPDVLNFFEYDYIAKVFAGRAPPAERDEAEEVETRPVARSQPRQRATSREEPPDDDPQPRPRQRVSRPAVEEVEEEDVEEEAEPANGHDREPAPIPRSARERLTAMNERVTRRG
jgi:hypothetical protein